MPKWISSWLWWLLPLGLMLMIVFHTEANRPVTTINHPNSEPRFGMKIAERKELFRKLTASTDSWKREAQRNFRSLPWKQDDHYHNRVAFYAIQNVPRLKQNYFISLLIYAEGVRAGWPSGRHTKEPIEPYTQVLKSRLIGDEPFQPKLSPKKVKPVRNGVTPTRSFKQPTSPIKDPKIKEEQKINADYRKLQRRLQADKVLEQKAQERH